MRIVIDNETFRKRRACNSRFNADCPYWDSKLQAIVYEDWNQSVIDHYLKVRGGGAEMLHWLVRHELVPMTMDQFNAAVAAARST